MFLADLARAVPRQVRLEYIDVIRGGEEEIDVVFLDELDLLRNGVTGVGEEAEHPGAFDGAPGDGAGGPGGVLGAVHDECTAGAGESREGRAHERELAVEVARGQIDFFDRAPGAGGAEEVDELFGRDAEEILGTVGEVWAGGEGDAREDVR